jgi:hypothetical protein
LASSCASLGSRWNFAQATTRICATGCANAWTCAL